MELTIKDRVLLLNEVMPQFDKMSGIITKKAITEKIKLSEAESGSIVVNRLPTGVAEIGFKTVEASLSGRSFDFSDEELFYIKNRIHMIDANGMISEDNIGTYQKILDAEFESEVYRNMWEEVVPSPIVQDGVSDAV